MIALINLPSLGESVDPAAASSKKGSTDRGSEPVAAEETQPAGLVFALPDPRSLLALMPAILSTSEKKEKTNGLYFGFDYFTTGFLLWVIPYTAANIAPVGTHTSIYFKNSH